MIRLPTRAELIRLVGGPTGPAEGAFGPVGPPGLVSVTGATGVDGITGRTGPTGYFGPAGLVALFVGATGPTGPTGSAVEGPRGPKGANALFPYTAYFENVVGLTITSSCYIGCKFSYTLQGSGQFFVIMTGLFTDIASTDPAWFSVDFGRPPSPNPGDPASGRPDNVNSWVGTEIYAPDTAIPFTVISAPFMGQDQHRDAGEEFWFDLRASGNGKVSNISCAILEP